MEMKNNEKLSFSFTPFFHIFFGRLVDCLQRKPTEERGDRSASRVNREKEIVFNGTPDSEPNS